MKLATDLEQSKKLAEILPLDSADMVWNVCVDDTKRLLPKNDWDTGTDGHRRNIPAWSLTALLNLMSDTGLLFTLRNIVPPYSENRWSISCTTDDEWFQTEGCLQIEACYKMIIKLKEKNIL